MARDKELSGHQLLLKARLLCKKGEFKQIVYANKCELVKETVEVIRNGSEWQDGRIGKW